MSYISKLEIGATSPTMISLKSLAQALDVSVDQLTAPEDVPVLPSTSLLGASSVPAFKLAARPDYGLRQQPPAKRPRAPNLVAETLKLAAEPETMAAVKVLALRLKVTESQVLTRLLNPTYEE